MPPRSILPLKRIVTGQLLVGSCTSARTRHLDVVVFGFSLQGLVRFQRRVQNTDDHGEKLGAPPSDHGCRSKAESAHHARVPVVNSNAVRARGPCPLTSPTPLHHLSCAGQPFLLPLAAAPNECAARCLQFSKMTMASPACRMTRGRLSQAARALSFFGRNRT